VDLQQVNKYEKCNIYQMTQNRDVIHASTASSQVIRAFCFVLDHLGKHFSGPVADNNKTKKHYSVCVCVRVCVHACRRVCVCVYIPQSPDELGELQEAGAYGQSELALSHGQLAVLE